MAARADLLLPSSLGWYRFASVAFAAVSTKTSRSNLDRDYGKRSPEKSPALTLSPHLSGGPTTDRTRGNARFPKRGSKTADIPDYVVTRADWPGGDSFYREGHRKLTGCPRRKKKVLPPANACLRIMGDDRLLARQRIEDAAGPVATTAAKMPEGRDFHRHRRPTMGFFNREGRVCVFGLGLVQPQLVALSSVGFPSVPDPAALMRG